MALYHLPKIKEIHPEAIVTMEVSIVSEEIKHGIGLISDDPLITEMTRSFYFNNLDNIPAIWEQTILSVQVNRISFYYLGIWGEKFGEQELS